MQENTGDSQRMKGFIKRKKERTIELESTELHEQHFEIRIRMRSSNVSITY